MTNKLKEYFPLLWEREELLAEIGGSRELHAMYEEWSRAQREEFLDFCTGVRGMKILYDSFFKEVMNPEYAPERLLFGGHALAPVSESTLQAGGRFFLSGY